VRQRDDEEGIETSQSSKSERSDDSESFLIKSDAETDREDLGIAPPGSFLNSWESELG
jgi:hypothetical protein